jgi:hypothetical protein
MIAMTLSTTLQRITQLSPRIAGFAAVALIGTLAAPFAAADQPAAQPQPQASDSGKVLPPEAVMEAYERIANGPEPEQDQPQGYAGRIPYRPRDWAGSDTWPIEDRWRVGFPTWDRYQYGRLIDPYHQNVLKGDYPICGDDIFFQFTGVSDSFFERRNLPVKVGDQVQRFNQQTLFGTFDIFQGDNSFHPSEWFFRATPAFRGVGLDPNPNNADTDVALQECFLDVQLAIVSDWYDTVNLRVGRQNFIFDFRGFLFADANDAVRLFGTYDSNRTQWNVFAFETVKKNAVSQFNTFDERQQTIGGANIFRQDFIFQGFNVVAGVLWDQDRIKNHVDAYYLELAGDGHIGRFLVDCAFIQALGHDQFNPIAKRPVTIDAQFAALEVAYQMDWFFPKVSAMYASGDRNPKNGRATGFDSVFDNPNFAGDGFSFLNREAVAPKGVILANTFSFLPDLRTKANDPVNFVNPGLVLLNTGFNANLTTRLQYQANLNWYHLADSEPVETLAKKAHVGGNIGTEINMGLVYKPLIVDNLIIQFGASVLRPGDTIKDLNGGDRDKLYTVFTAITATY